MNRLALKCVIIGLCLFAWSHARDFGIERKIFSLDGQPFQIRSGEIHYPRVPKDAWRSRIQMAKAMGLNTISTYVFWNYHETMRGELDFSGEKDFPEFLRICQEEGMYVIVRPGPYVSAGWDLGGIPSWLLGERGIKLRSTDPKFLEPATAWMTKVAELIQPYSAAANGPVILLQMEHEYANNGDPNYLPALKSALRQGGYTGLISTSDLTFSLAPKTDALSDVLKSVNFGSGAKSSLARLESVAPDQPIFIADYWTGTFDKWNQPRQQTRNAVKLGEFEWIASQGISFNLYMFHGGTTRDLWNGAILDPRYHSVIDSFDYSAPLDESGRPTPTYFAYRDIIQRSLKEQIPEIPKLEDTGSIGTIDLTAATPFSESWPKGITSTNARPMEDMGQSRGFILYRKQVSGPLDGILNLGAAKDRVQVLLDGSLIGISGRSSQTPSLNVSIPAGVHQLDFLVENMGRVFYGPNLEEERKGLDQSVRIGETELKDFETVALPMEHTPQGKFSPLKSGDENPLPVVYSGRVDIPKPKDTFLDMKGFGRGIVWFNGHNLGRYWNVGPSQTIFLPACWMRENSVNEITILELEQNGCPTTIETCAHPIWKN